MSEDGDAADSVPRLRRMCEGDEAAAFPVVERAGRSPRRLGYSQRGVERQESERSQ